MWSVPGKADETFLGAVDLRYLAGLGFCILNLNIFPKILIVYPVQYMNIYIWVNSVLSNCAK